jgi:hypothetical protein
MSEVRSAVVVSTLDAGTPVVPARTDIWPPRERYGLSRLELVHPLGDPHVELVGHLVDQLMALADASFALARSGVASPGAGVELREAAARVLRLLGGELGGELRLSLSDRADAIEAEDWQANAWLTVDCEDHRFVALYGPLHTWSMKGDGFGFSGAAGLRNDRAADFVRSVEGAIFEAGAEVGPACGTDPLAVTHVPAYVVTDLIGCGGEANTFPKHFAYFLPEDANVADRGKTMTVVFRNVFLSQFERISAPVASIAADGWTTPRADTAERALLTWFRGHDIAHFMGQSGPPPDHLLGWPGFLRGALQETFADVLGFLLASTQPVLDRAGLKQADMSSVFFAEMMRYFRRGWQWFPDSCAAQVELAYLVDHGWLKLDQTKHIAWDAEAFHQGMLDLGQTVVAAMLHGDNNARQTLGSYCTESRPRWLDSFEKALLSATTGVPDGLYYTYLP